MRNEGPVTDNGEGTMVMIRCPSIKGPVKVIQIDTLAVGGGAARAAYRLTVALRRLGVDSTKLVESHDIYRPEVELFDKPMDLSSRVIRVLRREYLRLGIARYRETELLGNEFFTEDRSKYGASLVSRLRDCDVINLHWIGGFVDIPSFFTKVPQRTPVVWTLHDMNPFTGGCHYDHGCGRFIGSCGACPQLGSNQKRDFSRQIWQRKKNAFDKVEPEWLQLVAASSWISDVVKTSSLMGRFPVTVIPHGLDLEVFAPRNRSFARTILGIPQEAKVVLFSAHALETRRKGFPVLVEALAELKKIPSLLLVSLGHGASEIPGHLEYMRLGHVDNERLLSLVYSAADIFVAPSLQEMFGLTVLEAMACGTPAVGSDVGGIREIIRHDVSGLLVPPGDPKLLGSAISELLNDPARLTTMSEDCRRIAIEEYDIELQARRYLELYEKVLAHHHH
ncbi:MAG: glycosyltransferase family 4 protein [Pseudomonadota bacterium]